MNREALSWAMARLHHGSHICAFYSQFSEAAGLLVPWVQEALSRREGVVYVADVRTADSARTELTRAGVDVPGEMERGALTFLGKSDWRHASKFNQQQMAEHVKAIVDSGLQAGCSGLWIAVEMTWTKDPDIDSAAVARWEGMWNDLLVGMPVVLLCMYDRSQFAPGFLRPELHTHPFVFHDGELYPSCYSDRVFYKCPERTQRRDLDSMLTHIREHVGAPHYAGVG